MADILTLPATIHPTQIETGMTIRVHQKIKDLTTSGEEKERVQMFEGIVLAVGGSKGSKTMTVRKMASGVGVEKIFPLALPTIIKIELVKKVKARRNDIGFIRHSKKRLKEVRNVTLRAPTA